MEFFYRTLRRQYKVLMDGKNGDEPVGGKWNFDAENRKGFGKGGPQNLPQPPSFEVDDLTRSVIAVVEQHFGDHPGDVSRFDWPVTRAQALVALDDFIEHRLPQFGVHQDAMWTDMDFGWHALLSSSLNLKLLHPLEVIVAAEKHGAKKTSIWPASKASSGRFWAGASSCGVCTFSTCPG